MKIKKHISKILVFGILANNLSILSNAGALSSDTRYETFEENTITINNIIENKEVDLEIEGNTLVNLQDNSRGWGVQTNGTTINNRVGISEKLKPSTDYTVIIYDSNPTIKLKRMYLTGIVKSGLINVFTTPSDLTASNKFLHVYTDEPIDDEYMSEVKAVVIEGDWTNRELPPYFEGTKSVGELENNTIKIKSQNKNLFNGEIINKDIDYRIEDGGYKEHSDSVRFSTDYIRCKKGSKYIFSINTENFNESTGTYFMFYDKNKNFVKKLPNKDAVAPCDGYFRIRSRNKYTTEYTAEQIEEFKNNFQVEENTSATSYEKHQSKEKEIILNEPLRGIEGFAKDRIIKKNGQWVIERNCGQLIVDGSQSISKEYNYAPTNTELVRFDIDIDGILEGKENKLLPDKLPYVYIHSGGSVNVSQECISNHSSSRNSLNIIIKKSRLDSDDVNGFKNWISNNPITIIYRLENPIYEPLNIDLTVNLFEETTHISNNSTVPTNMKVVVDRVVNRAKEFSEAAKLNPTMENLSRARMWINLMDESTLKDQFQEDISNIADISDIALERKSASSNLDVYVKSQNMLSMSLDTNTVTFDGYSGTEDMEKLGVVNISINSSLPYSLNAYLPTEIANADKSEIIPIDTLNIRESNEGVYKTFANTVDKIVLKDNCSNGNDLMHNIDLKLASSLAHKADVYKTVIKFEAEQK